MGKLSFLKPEDVFTYFERLCSVPHGSKNTKAISDLCVRMAQELGLRYRQDALNDVIIWKPGSEGYENSQPVILQGHIDMVCVTVEGSGMDLSVNGPIPCTDGVWVWADRTSLGGDNAIAIAMILAILADDSLAHPPLEAVFTVDEEAGMTGAIELDCSDLHGRTLINLDSAVEGLFTVSCAGGGHNDCYIPAKKQAVQDYAGYQLSVSGLQGGHSGMEINRGRANAIQVMLRTLFEASQCVGEIRLADMQGGRFGNVICSKCDAVIAVPADLGPALEQFVQEFGAVLRREYTGTDDGITLSCTSVSCSEAISAADTERIISGLFSIPQGVLEMSTALEGLVQTSENMGSVFMTDEELVIGISVRSAVETRKAMALHRIRAVAELLGGYVKNRDNFPSWEYAAASPIRDRVLAAYREVTGREGRIEATHAGLECGLFAEKIPGLDAISIGPDLENAHSVEERLNVASTKRIYEVVCRTLAASK